jgi:anti-anti-sigma factor
MEVVFEKDSINSVNLGGSLNISSAEELKAILLRALESKEPVRISLEQVGEMDVTAVQLLFAARDEARRAGTAFQFAEQTPAPVVSFLDSCGFEDFPTIDAAK